MHVDFPQSRCRLGIARRDITPPAGIYHRMWGAAAHDRSEGVHRPLLATALVLAPLDPGASGMRVTVALDHCLLFEREMRAIADRVAAAANVDPAAVVVTFSHTHGAGLMDPGRTDVPGGDMIGPYLEQLADDAVAAVKDATANLQPVTIQYATGRCSLATDRDLYDAERDITVCGFNPQTPADDTLLVARAADGQGRAVATIVNYACHPTTLAWDNRLISPDYPGAMRETVEAATHAPCLFLLGASGDLGPRDGYVGDTAVAERNGRQLGYAALAALETLPPPGSQYVYDGPVISGATIGVWKCRPLSDEAQQRAAAWQHKRVTVELTYRDDLPTRHATETELARRLEQEAASRASGDLATAADMRALAERARRQLTRLRSLPPGRFFPYQVDLLRLGDAVWVSVEGEPYNLLQRELRRRFPAVPLVVSVLAGGWRPAYLPTRDAYGRGIYQETVAVLAPGSLEMLIERTADELGRLI
jgi:hypothetical protein